MPPPDVRQPYVPFFQNDLGAPFTLAAVNVAFPPANYQSGTLLQLRDIPALLVRGEDPVGTPAWTPYFGGFSNRVISPYITAGAVVGDLVYVSADDTVTPADATSLATARLVGVVVATNAVCVKGQAVVRFIPGLVGVDTPAAGRVAYLAVAMPGQASTVPPAPTATGQQVVAAGIIANASGYAGGTCVVELVVPLAVGR